MGTKIDRREFLKKGIGSIATVAAISSPVSELLGQEESIKPVRIGVIGTGARGRDLMKMLFSMPKIEMPALCDINEAHLNLGKEIVKKFKGITPDGYSKGPYDYRRMLERDDLDGVLIATPIEWHGVMSIDAMKAGKHVGCEVPGEYDLDELWELVKTKEETGMHYTILENYIYPRERMMVYNMLNQGIFGEPYYAECCYIGDLKYMAFNSDGTLTWRGKLGVDNYGNYYPTHAIGPVAKWLGINDGDRMEYCVSMMTKPRVLHQYAVKHFGPDSDAAKIKFKMGEFTSTLIYTAKGKVIRVDFDVLSPRPDTHYYLVQGEKGIYDSRSGIYIDDGSKRWSSANKYLPQYDHPC